MYLILYAPPRFNGFIPNGSLDPENVVQKPHLIVSVQYIKNLLCLICFCVIAWIWTLGYTCTFRLPLGLFRTMSQIPEISTRACTGTSQVEYPPSIRVGRCMVRHISG